MCRSIAVINGGFKLLILHEVNVGFKVSFGSPPGSVNDYFETKVTNINPESCEVVYKAHQILKHVIKYICDHSQCKQEYFTTCIHQVSSYLSYTCAERNKNNSDRCVCPVLNVCTHKLPQICQMPQKFLN